MRPLISMIYDVSCFSLRDDPFSEYVAFVILFLIIPVSYLHIHIFLCFQSDFIIVPNTNRTVIVHGTKRTVN